MKTFGFVQSIVLFVIVGILVSVYFTYDGVSNRPTLENKYSTASKLTRQDCQKVCVTKDCLMTANMFLESMNTTIDPCVDFYQYSCGTFESNNPPEHERSINRPVKMKSNQVDFIGNILENIKKSRVRGASQKTLLKMRMYYEHCIQDIESEFSFVMSIKQTLSGLGIHGWPRLPQNFAFKEVSLEKILGRLQILNQYSFISVTSHYNDKYSLDISPKSLILKSTYYLKNQKMRNKTFKDYREMIILLLSLFGLEGKEGDHYVDEILHLEIQLAQFLISDDVPRNESLASDDDDVDQDDSQSSIQYEDVNSNWNNVIQYYLENVASYESNISLFRRNTDDKLQVEHLKEFVDALPDRLVANYLSLRLVIQTCLKGNFFLESSLEENSVFNTYGSISDYPIHGSKKSWCRNEAYKKFSDLMTSVLIAETFNSNALKTLEVLYDEVLKSVIFTTTSTIQMDNETKSSLMKYISDLPSIAQRIRDFCTPDDIDELYDNLEIHQHSSKVTDDIMLEMHKNKISYNGFSGGTKFADIVKKCSSLDTQISAYADEDGITVNMGMLNYPMFSSHRTFISNLGSIGFILAHEFTHLLHQQFKIFEITETDQNKFEDHKSCLYSLYSKLKYRYMNKQGKNGTFSEDFADNVALSIIHNVAQRFLNTQFNLTASKLPGLMVISEKELFLSVAETWCENQSEEQEILQYRYGDHSKHEHIILGIFSNSKAFSEAYQCPLHSPMNPQLKCNFVD